MPWRSAAQLWVLLAWGATLAWGFCPYHPSAKSASSSGYFWGDEQAGVQRYWEALDATIQRFAPGPAAPGGRTGSTELVVSLAGPAAGPGGRTLALPGPEHFPLPVHRTTGRVLTRLHLQCFGLVLPQGAILPVVLPAGLQVLSWSQTDCSRAERPGPGDVLQEPSPLGLMSTYQFDVREGGSAAMSAASTVEVAALRDQRRPGLHNCPSSASKKNLTRL
eukprot:g29420.t1